jgi:hypothetical protein
MTTLSELRKLARTSLTPELEKRGFKLAPKRLQYWRKKSDVYHILSAQVFSGGAAMRLWAFPWVPEGQGVYDMSRFPDRVAVYAGGALGEHGIGVGGKSWAIATEADAHASFRDILRLLDTVGIPELDKITTRQALADAVLPSEQYAPGGILRADLVLGRAVPPRLG